jgi:hypothetical protein
VIALQARIEQVIARLCADEHIELADVVKAIEKMEKRNGEWDEPKPVHE